MNATDTPKAIPIAAPGEGTIATRVAAGLGLRPTLLEEWHFLRLAIVYVRQSDPQQVLNHLESRERQYALVDLAAALGWPRDRILLIDEDQGITGKTAERRTGFHRLLAEVTMDHVGVIFGIDMSRMARNNKDWHHLMEMCAIFGTILADEDRIYDPRDAEDRLLLGFKGTISEYELVLMHNRLERGRLHKAKRGALILDVPCGYVKLPTGEVARDPDEQVQATVQLVFDKFDELGSCRRLYRHLVRNQIRLGMRVHRGPRRGQLEWRLPTPGMLGRMLHHPIYAGAYSWGRRRVDHKRTAASAGKLKMREMPMSEWIVLQQDRLPAYITWERYLANQQRLLQNGPRTGAPGVPRSGKALLTSLLVCGACGRRMYASYRSKSTAYYGCMRRKNEGSTCCGLEAGAVDDLVAQQVLRALEPATLELSLKAIQDVHKERDRLHRHWKHRLERATYEAERAERQYRAVEPENRLVVRSLERHWEQAMRNQRDLAEEYDRFLKEQPPHLSDDQRARILALSSDLPTLWNAPETTAADRKEIIRLVVDRVVVHVRADSECAEAVIWWRGGVTTRHEIVSPGFALRIIGPLRSVDQPDRRTAPRGPDDQANRGAAQRGRVSHPKIPEGLHEHVGAEALVSLRADPWEDRDQATRSPRVVVAGLGPRFKCQWTSCASGRYAAGFARGRSRREVCGSSGPMGGNDADCGSSWQTRVRASLRNKRRHEEGYQF